MSTIDKFTLWLSSHPDANEIARHLVEVCFAEYEPISSRISKINNDGSLTFIGEFGHVEELLGKTYPAQEWHKWREEKVKTGLDLDSGNWNEERKLVVSVLVDNSNVHGFVVVDFAQSVDDPAMCLAKMKSLSYPLSIYLAGEGLIGTRSRDWHGASPFPSNAGRVPNADEAEQFRKQLTDRQIDVLKSVAQGKTNNEIAKNLGYSVSTIRHDVMHLFRVLRISARNEAGPRAAELGII